MCVLASFYPCASVFIHVQKGLPCWTLQSQGGNPGSGGLRTDNAILQPMHHNPAIHGSAMLYRDMLFADVPCRSSVLIQLYILGPILALEVCEVRTMLGRACRWGEALHPGPAAPCFNRIGILNPSSVKTKVDRLVNFMNEKQLHMLCLSETNATVDIQKRMTTSLRRKTIRCAWSLPVPVHLNAQQPEGCDRAKSGGVAVMARTPVRKQVIPQEQLANLTHRTLIHHCIIRFVTVSTGSLLRTPPELHIRQAAYQSAS